MKKYTGQSHKGFILITSYMLIAVMQIFSFGLFARSHEFLLATERNKNKIIAFSMAEAGFDDALVRIKSNSISSYPWQSNYVTLDTGHLQGGYETTVTSKGDGVVEISVTGYAPTKANTGVRALESRTVVGYVGTPSAFNYSVYAKEKMAFKGNAGTDSYNSDLGPYNAATANKNGNIGTDSVKKDSVKLNGYTTINGSVTVGPGGNPDSIVKMSSNATVTGTQSATTKAQNFQPVSTSIASEGDLKITGNTVYELCAGTHRFDSIKIEGNGVLAPLGAVKIYVDGKVDVGGNGIVTVDNKPTNFLLYATSDKDMKLAGNTTFYGAIFAPNSKVGAKGNADLYGAVVAKSFKDNGDDGDEGEGNIHYDEALKDIKCENCSPTLLSWRETNTTAGS